MNVIKGTGKTATFAINILQQVEANVQQCQALVLAPTRELAQQIVKVDDLIQISPQILTFVVTFFPKVIQQLGDFLRVKVHACVGGTLVRDDMRILQEGVHVVVGR